MANVAPEVDAPAKVMNEGQINLDALKNLDPELSKLCSELDLDGDGTINAAELTRACGVIRETRDESAEWQKAAFRRMIAIVVLLAVNLALIGTVTYYIVWSTAAVRVDENGNLVNFHEDSDGESAPSPVAAQEAIEHKNGLDALFENAEYNRIDMLAYTDTNGAQFVRPKGFGVFERTVGSDAMDVVVVYVDGSTALVVENKIQEPYVIDPMAPYTIENVAFGEVKESDLTARRRQLKEAGKGDTKLKNAGKAPASKGSVGKAAQDKTKEGSTKKSGKTASR